MTIRKYISSIASFALFVALLTTTFGCEKDEITYEKTRLFRPALNEDLSATGNVILVNLAKIKEATSYNLEVSQDSFKTVAYAVTVDTNYVFLDKSVLGEDLLYNTLYQVRVSANAASSEYNSKIADLGSVRTERFPSILLLPRVFDVTDKKARVRWRPGGATVTQVKTFSKSDVRLTSPIAEYPVSQAQNDAGEVIIDQLVPSTEYQIAIYSNNVLRGWVDYATLVAGIDPNGANVVNLSEEDNPDAFAPAVAGAADGAIILLKKGVRYNIPTDPLNKSITMKSAYGLVAERTELFTTGDWKVASGAKIDHIVFDDLDFIGEDMGGDYVFNISNSGEATVINELTFQNCVVQNVRGIARLRSDSFIKNFNIKNTIVHDLGNYGVFTCDTDGAGKASIDHANFENSTFYKLTIFVTSRQNMQSFKIDACTFSEFTQTGQQTFRFRGAEGLNNILNGLTISNSIFGHGWDIAVSGDKAVAFNKDGLKNTNLSITNTWATSDFAAVAATEMAGFPAATYGKAASTLWVAPYDGNFNIADGSFAGKTDSGDPRWRVRL